MAKMNYNRKERVRLKADFLRLILNARVDPARKNMLAEFVETYMPLNRAEGQQFEQTVTVERKYEGVVEMITTYEKKGIKKGRTEGQQKAVLLQLEKKFGKLSPAIKKTIRQIESPKRLESLLLSVLDAESMDDLQL